MLLPLLLVPACGYKPPPGTDVDSHKYQDDLAACDKSAGDPIRLHYAQRVGRWLGSFVTRWTSIPDAIAACMREKGYVEPGRKT